MRLLPLIVLLGACSSPAEVVDASVVLDLATVEAPDGASCTTRVTYGAAWIHSHPASFDVVNGPVTWDGSCIDDGDGTSHAVLSNGWQPSFTGQSGCVIALDSDCAPKPACTTRVTYGAGWLPPSNHPQRFDDVPGRVFSDGSCVDAAAPLSNGWAPHYSSSTKTCPLSFEYTQCGGLYTNPVIGGDCPDPGVLRDGDTYVLSCTSGDAPAAFPLYTSTDLASWTRVGSIFPTTWPTWASGDLWAPEVHRVGTGYVAYFTARSLAGALEIGAATAPSATGPFTDLGAALVTDASVGLIDPSMITTSTGASYLMWKEDGNATGMPTPIHAQALSADGLSLTGTRATLITNDLAWEGAVTEAPWMIERQGMFYLFYSGSSYANASYAVGVARATSPLGPFTKHGDPILVTDATWVGTGHCSVVDAPSGDTAIVYHAWQSGCVNGPGCGREVLADEVVWGTDGWPSVALAPSSTTRPTL